MFLITALYLLLSLCSALLKSLSPRKLILKVEKLSIYLLEKVDHEAVEEGAGNRTDSDPLDPAKKYKA